MSIPEVSITAYYETLKFERVSKLQERIDTINKNLAENGPEKVALALKALLEACLSLDQTEPVYEKDFIETKKVCQIYTKQSQKLIESVYGIKVYKIPYYGLFTAIDGILTSRQYKDKCGYSSYESSPFNSELNNVIFAEISSTDYRTDLVSPAVDGLFLPKVCPFVSLFSNRHQIVFFDVNDY